MSQFIKESDLHTPQEEIKTENIVQNIPQSENTTAQNTEKKSEKGKNLKIIFWVIILSLMLLSWAVYLIYKNTSQISSEGKGLQENLNWWNISKEVTNSIEKTTNSSQENSQSGVQEKAENNTAMEAYLMRTRDTNRIASLKNFYLAFSTYAVDNWKIPEELSSGCVPFDELKDWYLRSIPTDPIAGRLNDGCTDTNAESTFGYRVLENTEISQKFIISATLETENHGNSPYSIDELVKNPELLKEVESGKYNKKGKYYIVVN